MATNRLAFVDSISPSPAVRLDLNDGERWRLVVGEGTEFPPPPLNRAISATLLANGAVIPAAAYGPRIVRAHLAILTDDAVWTSAQMHALLRELDRPFNVLRWQRDAAAPIFFQTKRAAPNSVREIGATRDGSRKHVLLELLAEPFAFGLEEIAAAGISISTDPAAIPDSIRVPNTAGSYASTPDAAALHIVGDLDIRARVALDDWTPAANAWLLGKIPSTGSQRAYGLFVDTTGAIGLQWSADGSTPLSRLSTVATGFTDGTLRWVRATLDVNNGAAGHDVKFFTTLDPDGVGAWTQVGTTVTTAGTTSIFPGTTQLEVGARDAGAAGLMVGNFVRGEVRDGIDGTPVAAPIATPVGITDPSGRVWNLNGAAALVRGYPTYVDVVGVKGDVETPALIRWPSSAVAVNRETMFSVRRRGNPWLARHVVQAEAMTLGQDAALQSNDATYSGPGSNSVLINFATGATLIERLSLATAGFAHMFASMPNTDIRGRYRVFARFKRTAGTGVLRVRFSSGAHLGPEIILPATANRVMVQLMEELPIPWGIDPVTHGASGTPIPVQGVPLSLFAARDSGSDTLAVDLLRLLPIDDRTAVLKFPAVGTDRWYFDAEDNSRHHRDGADWLTDAGGIPSLSGGFPLLSPDETNRIYVLQEIGSGLATSLTTVSPVSISYWPLYVDVPSL